MKKVLYLFFAWRILLFLPLIVSELFLKFRVGFEYTSPNYFIQNSLISNFLISSWANFDGIYYLIIAAKGYTVDNVGFFPAFPILINFFSFNSGAFSIQQFFIALIIPFVAFIVGLLMFYKLLKIDYPEKTAILTIIAILVFPTSFFFASIYSESIFFLFAILSFYFARKKNWFLASLFGLFLSGTRIVGIMILPALIYEFYVQHKTFLNKKIISLFFIPLGLLSYMYFNFVQFGNPLQFVSAQGALLNNRSVDKIILFPQTVFRYIKILFSVTPSNYDFWIALLELGIFAFVFIMFFVAWKKKIRTSYLIFSVLAFLVPISTGTFSGIPRYAIVLFPIFIGIALIKNKKIKIVYSVIGAVLLFILFMLFSKGYYIS